MKDIDIYHTMIVYLLLSVDPQQLCRIIPPITVDYG